MTPTAAPAAIQASTPWIAAGAALAGLVLTAAALLAAQPALVLVVDAIALLGLLGAAAFVDARHGRLPNRLLAPAAALLATTLPLHAIATGEPARIGQGLLGAGIAAAIYLAAWAARATGAGDVKLATIVGMFTTYLAWTSGAIALAAPYLLAIPAVIYFASKRRLRGRLPFGPYLVAGLAIATLAYAIAQ